MQSKNPKHLEKRKNIIIDIIVFGLIIIGVFSFFNFKNENASAGELDNFAQCLKEKNAIFYGAFWCPHCKEQKAIFGSSVNLIPYVECSPSNRQGQYPICNKNNIQSYPTWIFADGNRNTGVLPLNMLAQKTGCKLPQPKV